MPSYLYCIFLGSYQVGFAVNMQQNRNYFSISLQEILDFFSTSNPLHD